MQFSPSAPGIITSLELDCTGLPILFVGIFNRLTLGLIFLFSFSDSVAACAVAAALPLPDDKRYSSLVLSGAGAGVQRRLYIESKWLRFLPRRVFLYPNLLEPIVEVGFPTTLPGSSFWDLVPTPWGRGARRHFFRFCAWFFRASTFLFSSFLIPTETLIAALIVDAAGHRFQNGDLNTYSRDQYVAC